MEVVSFNHIYDFNYNIILLNIVVTKFVRSDYIAKCSLKEYKNIKQIYDLT